MTYHPVQAPRRWRRRTLLRRVPWRGLTWLAGVGGATGWWAAQPEVGWANAAMAGCAFALLLGAALGGPGTGGRP